MPSTTSGASTTPSTAVGWWSLRRSPPSRGATSMGNGSSASSRMTVGLLARQLPLRAEPVVLHAPAVNPSRQSAKAPGAELRTDGHALLTMPRGWHAYRTRVHSAMGRAPLTHPPPARPGASAVARTRASQACLFSTAPAAPGPMRLPPDSIARLPFGRCPHPRDAERRRRPLRPAHAR